MSIRRALTQVASRGKFSPHNKKGLGSVGGDLLRQQWLCGQNGFFQNKESWSSVNTSRVTPCFAQKANVHAAAKSAVQSALFPLRSLRNALRTPFQPLQNTPLQSQQLVGSGRTNTFRSPRNGCKATFTSSPVHSDQDRTEDHGATDKFTPRNHGQEALVEWVRLRRGPLRRMDKEIIDRLMKDIEQREVQFGLYPFDTQLNAQTFFAELLGLSESDANVTQLAALAFLKSEKYRQQRALIEWVKNQPYPRLHELLDEGVIEEEELEFGPFPFDTEHNAQQFFVVLFKGTSETTTELGTKFFKESIRYMSGINLLPLLAPHMSFIIILALLYVLWKPLVYSLAGLFLFITDFFV